MDIIQYNMKQNEISDYCDGMIYEFDPSVETGINFPFQLYIPNEVNEISDLFVEMCSSSLTNKSFNQAIENAKFQNSSANKKSLNISTHTRLLVLKNKCPLLLPIIPRIFGLCPYYMGYGIYNKDFKKAIEFYQSGKSMFSDKDLNKFVNLDNQIVKMIDYATDFLSQIQISVDNKVIMSGYNVGAKFANYFSCLHPNKVKAIIAGGINGLAILPIKNYKGWTLDYPLGINDVSNVDVDAFKNIKQFYYMGDKDNTDIASVKVKLKKDKNGNVIKLTDNLGNVVPDLDKSGNYVAMFNEGYYSDYQINAINRGFSSDVQKRFDMQSVIYSKLGINATFKKYPGDQITVLSSKELYLDINAFYEEIKKAKANKPGLL